MQTTVRALIIAVFLAPAIQAQAPRGDAVAIISVPRITQEARGRHVVQDVTLANSVTSYTLRYEFVEKKDDPNRIEFAKWAPTLGYTPLGILAPSMACWYNQGFFIWTLDDLNIQSYRARMRVVRAFGPDAMVEYVWDTPKAKVFARLAITQGSDKLLFFGRVEPKTEIHECRLRLMAYPATFSKPHVRSMTTAVRTLTRGKAVIDPSKERWILLEDTAKGRTGDGSAGLLLGDPNSFATVTVDSIGGYGEYVNLALKPGVKAFALGLYECPALPDPYATRAYFKRLGDRESEHLAAVLHADLDRVLAPMPVDPKRMAALRAGDRDRLDRPAESWSVPSTPLSFPWMAHIPGPQLKVALLCPRWAAYETMELARRIPLDVEHLYFDTASDIVNSRAWPYARVTGTGTLGAGLAMKEAVRICSDPDRDAFFVAGVRGGAIPDVVKHIVLDRVQRAGKLLVLAGTGSILSGWPKDLTAQPISTVTDRALGHFPWEALPGLRAGERGRLGESVPWTVYRYGNGRIIVFKAGLGPYSTLVPLSDAVEGLDGAADRVLAAHALVLLAAAGRDLPAVVRIEPPAAPVTAGTPCELRIAVDGPEPHDLLVRVQDDCDEVIFHRACFLGKDGRLRLPALPAGREYFVDVLARDAGGACLGVASARLTVQPVVSIADIALSPVKRFADALVPTVPLAGGGRLTCTVRVEAAATASRAIQCEVRDCFERLLVRARASVGADGIAKIALDLPPAVTVWHRLDVTVRGATGRPLAVRRQRFTVNRPYPYDDFTVLLWSYARGELVTRRVQRACYDLGTDMMDLCHMRGYTDAGAAREYAVAARSGLRLVPYVTRIAMNEQPDLTLRPGLFNEGWITKEQESIERCSRQAAPYRPAAYTLGDENYMSRGTIETGAAPETMAAFRTWLEKRYGSIAKLNAVWNTRFAHFAEITSPMLLEDAAKQTQTFAPFFDHQAFMDIAFAGLHERLAETVRRQDPGAKVGWDGLLGYHWLAGYNFYNLTRHLELNQVYTSHYLQGELVRSLKRPGALTGEWGNNIADNADGFAAIGWFNLFRGHNSCWWWTSWGCDYTPFNPDLTVSNMGRWFFKDIDEIRSGIGKLLLHARRADSGIAILYSQADMVAARLAGKFCPGTPFAEGSAFLDDHRRLARALEDLGYQFRYVAAEELEHDSGRLGDFRVLMLPLSTCLSDAQVAAIRGFVQRGGTLVADGRTGLLTGNGGIRRRRPLDAVFNTESKAGLEAFRQSSPKAAFTWDGVEISVRLLEPDFALLPEARALVETGSGPVAVRHRFGKGRTLFLNFAFNSINPNRAGIEDAPLLRLMQHFLEQFGLAPYCRLTVSGGKPARAVEQTLFTDGPIRYLALQQDIYQQGLPPQDIHVRRAESAIVVDMRTGKLVGSGPIREWDARISRGRPLLYALLQTVPEPLDVNVPEAIALGRSASVSVSIGTADKNAFHVVHLAVFAPGARREHRQYSFNIACPNGKGRAIIPFALNDPRGKWRIELRDPATGRAALRKILVSEATIQFAR